MYSQHLYEMQPLSFLLACNLLAIFQAEQGEQSKEDTQATTTPTIPYAMYMENSSSIPRNIKCKEVSDLSELAEPTVW